MSDREPNNRKLLPVVNSTPTLLPEVLPAPETHKSPGERANPRERVLAKVQRVLTMVGVADALVGCKNQAATPAQPQPTTPHRDAGSIIQTAIDVPVPRVPGPDVVWAADAPNDTNTSDIPADVPVTDVPTTDAQTTDAQTMDAQTNDAGRRRTPRTTPHARPPWHRPGYEVVDMMINPRVLPRWRASEEKPKG